MSDIEREAIQIEGAAPSAGPPNASPTIARIAAALAGAQANITAAIKNQRNPHLKNKYADLSAVWDAVRPALAEHFLAVLQRPCGDELETLVVHNSGEWIASRTAIQVGRSNNPAQAYGAALTYARRYGLTAMLGVPQEDDDGEGAGTAKTTKTPAKSPKVEDLAEEAKSSLGAVDVLDLIAGELGKLRDGEPSEAGRKRLAEIGAELADLKLGPAQKKRMGELWKDAKKTQEVR